MVTFQWKSQTSQNQNFEFFLKIRQIEGRSALLKNVVHINKLWRIFRRLFLLKPYPKLVGIPGMIFYGFLMSKIPCVPKKISKCYERWKKLRKFLFCEVWDFLVKTKTCWGTLYVSKSKALPTYIRSKSLFDIRDSWSWPRSPVFPGHSGSLQLKLLLLDSLHNDPGIPVNLGSRFIEHLSILAHLTNIIFQFVQILILVVHNFSLNIL